MEQEIIINQNDTQQITINSNNPQLITLNNANTQDLEISQNENQDLSITQPDNQVVLIDGGGAIIGITDVLVNGVTVVSGNIAYITVPTKTSELQNNSGFITQESDPTVPNVVKQITLADINNWNSKQNALVSGSTIKTINNESLLGSGNIQISGTQYSAGYGIDITNDIITNVITSYNDLVDLPTIPSKTSDLINDSDFVSSNELAEVAFTGGYGSLSNTPEYLSDFINDTNYVDTTELSTELSTKQDTLVSGTNIKTINNTSLLGSGNINIGGGTATDVQINGTSITSNNVADIITKSSYNATTNKIATESDIPTTTSELTNDSNFAVTNADNNFSAAQTFTKVEATTNVSTPSIELSAATPYIDFHFNNTTTDFTSRIIESSSGTLNIVADLNKKGNTVLSASEVYYNSSGTTGNIVFSDITGYSYLEIYYKGPHTTGIACTKIDVSLGLSNGVCITMGASSSSSTVMYILTTIYTLSSTGLSPTSYKQFRTDTAATTATNGITIYKIIGYK